MRPEKPTPDVNPATDPGWKAFRNPEIVFIATEVKAPYNKVAIIARTNPLSFGTWKAKK